MRAICLKLTIKTPEQCQYVTGVFISFEPDLTHYFGASTFDFKTSKC